LIESKLDWRAVAGKAARREVSPKYEIAEATYQSLPAEKRQLAWPVLSRAVVKPAGLPLFGEELKAVVRVFYRAGILDAYDRFEDANLMSEWPRLAEWISTDQELLSFLKRLRGHNEEANGALVGHGDSLIITLLSKTGSWSLK